MAVCNIHWLLIFALYETIQIVISMHPFVFTLWTPKVVEFLCLTFPQFDVLDELLAQPEGM